MPDEKVAQPEETTEETKAPISEICAKSEDLAAEQLKDDKSDVEPVSGFFFTSQRWH
jgi:hypothetical protein